MIALALMGGDVTGFARGLAASGLPTVALVQAERARPRTVSQLPYVEWSPLRRYPSIDAPAGISPQDLVTRIREAGLGATVLPGGASVWDLAWQPTTTFPEGRPLALPLGWQPAKADAVRIVEGRVTTRLPAGEAVRVSDLLRLAWPQRVKAHWLYDPMWVYPVAVRAEPGAFLRALASALGARLEDSDGAVEIVPDPAEFRRRAVASVEARAPKAKAGALALASHRVALEAWKTIDDAMLLRLFSKPNLALSRPVVKGSALDAALLDYLRGFRAWTQKPPPDMEGAMVAPRALLSRLDLKGEPRIVYAQNLGASGGWPRLGGGTVVP